MKNLVKLMLILLLVLSVLITAVTCEAQAPAQAAEAAAAEAQAAQERWVAVVTSAQGGVYVQHPGQTLWVLLKVADKCYPGDSIRVEENSRAALVFKNDSTLRIDQNTTLTFQPMEEQTVLMRIFKGAATFFSRIPRSLKIFTPHMNGTVKGTEFVIRVDGDQTQINLFDGQILAENEKGELLISKGQSVIAKTGQAPVAQVVVRPRDAVQWALYYPAIMDFRPEDFPGGADWQGKTRQSIEAWRKGDLSAAFASLKGIDDAGVKDTRYLAYRATLSLAVGQAQEASGYLDRILTADPKNANAYALQSIIATAQNNKIAAMDLATRAVSFDPQSPTARVALSYAQQALFDINGATSSVQKAVQVSPNDAYAHARLAELWLSQGYLDRALEEAQRAVTINPNIARTQTVMGYAYLTQVKIAESKAAFEKAIGLDSADPLPRLGLGLAIIRKGGLEEGRREIEIAASLDVNNSLIRSYLGKAYYEEKRENLSATQLGIAKELDPKDPTPWFYDAILKQSVNRPVEALQDIQKSIDLNDNRAVYRSKLLLDQDLAARSASLGQIFNNLGFQQIALIEGAKSISTDPTNFSAHRFLAEVYSSQPRNEVGRVSEILQSQLLQPINITPVPPQLSVANLKIFEGAGPSGLSFNEYNPLFNMNRLYFQGNGVWGQNKTIGDDLVLSNVYDQYSMSVGQFYYKTDGFRANNDQVKSLYNIFGQAMLTPSTSVQAELRYSDFSNGDLPLRFDPNDYYPQDRYDDKTHSARLGIRHAFSPNIDLLGSFIYSRMDSEQIYPSMFYQSDGKTDNYLAEIQALYRMDAFRAIAGAGYFDLSGQSLESFTGIDPYTVNYSLRHSNAYLYTLTTFPETMTWTLGLSADFFRRSADDYEREQLNPKFGVVWNPVPDTTIRAAAFRTLKRSLPSQQTLEPTQVAGFAQFFDDDEGTDAWRYGLGIDQKIRGNLFIGAEVSYRSLEVPYQRLDPVTFQLSNDTAKWHEELAGAYIYWAPHPWLAFKAEYRYERQDRDYPMVGWENITMVKTNSFPLGINFFHPSGLLLQMKGTYVLQDADYYDVASAAYVPGSDNFWVVDAVIGYRLPKRFGVISIEGKNLLNSNFRFVDTDPAFPRIFPDRVILGKISLSF